MMTYKEALSLLKNEMDVNDIIESMNTAIESLEKAEKYKWHDLRKGPKDLPHGKNVVLAFDGAEYGVAVFYNSGIYHGWATSDQDLEPSEIAAWREIEPFKEDDEE